MGRMSQKLLFDTQQGKKINRDDNMFLARPGRKQANVSVRMAWIFFGALLAEKEKETLIIARVSMLLKSRASLACFQACLLPGRAKDLSAPLYFSSPKHSDRLWYPAWRSTCTEDSPPPSKAVAAWSLPITSIQCRGKKYESNYTSMPSYVF